MMAKKNTVRKTLSLVLTLMMALTLMSVSAFAAGNRTHGNVPNYGYSTDSEGEGHTTHNEKTVTVYVYVDPAYGTVEGAVLNKSGNYTVGTIQAKLPIANSAYMTEPRGCYEEYAEVIESALESICRDHNPCIDLSEIEWHSLYIRHGADDYVDNGKPCWVLEGGVAGTAEEPTGEPTEEPTGEPTEEPTEEPTGEPTEEPTEEIEEVRVPVTALPELVETAVSEADTEEIGDEAVPEGAFAELVIAEQEIPQAEVPQTGDSSIALIVAAVSGVALIVLAAASTKRKEERK